MFVQSSFDETNGKQTHFLSSDYPNQKVVVKERMSLGDTACVYEAQLAIKESYIVVRVNAVAIRRKKRMSLLKGASQRVRRPLSKFSVSHVMLMSRQLA